MFAATSVGNIDVVSITIFEANPLGLIHHGREPALFHETRSISHSYEAALAAGEADVAKRIIDFGGRWIFRCLAKRGSGLLPPDGICQRSALAQRVRVRDRIAGLCVPRYAGSGAVANPVTVAITDVLGSSIGNVRREIVKGAGHLFIFSHSAE